MIEKVKLFFKDIFFNHRWRCVVCKREKFNDGFVCESCEKVLPYIEKRCKHCGRALLRNADVCDECRGELISFNQAVSVFDYGESIATLIRNFKYEGQRYLKEYFGEKLYTCFINSNINCDIVTYVPMSSKEYKKRGYNQAELLAKEFIKRTKYPIFNGLIKRKETKRQAGLNFKERLENLESAFAVKNKKTINGKNVLLIDDVLTTGATAERVSATLKRAGALRVYVLTVASVSNKRNKEK